MKKQTAITKIRELSQNTFNNDQKQIAINIVESAKNENQVAEFYSLVVQKVKVGLTFDESVNIPTGEIAVVSFSPKQSLITENGVDNSFIIGENLDALKNLRVLYKEKIDIIYIDPPYNTESAENGGNQLSDSEQEKIQKKQNEGKGTFKYTDKFSRTGWLNMIKARLLIAKELLKENGIIFVSIDDNEQAYLKVIMDEIFGEDKFLGMITRKTSAGAKNKAGELAKNADYILVYKRQDKISLTKKEKDAEAKKYSHYDSSSKRYFRKRTLQMQGAGQDLLKYRKDMGYSIYFNSDNNKIKILYDYSKETLIYEKPNEKLLKENYKCYRPSTVGKEPGRWRWSNFEKNFDNNLLFEIGKVYQKEWKKAKIIKPFDTFWAGFLNSQGTKDLKAILGYKAFDFPKPVSLIKELISIYDNKNAIILDFYAGSGTTGEAVMALNKDDKGTRRYILASNDENKIATEVAIPRLKKIIKEVVGCSNNSLKVFNLENHSVELTSTIDNLADDTRENFKLLNNQFVPTSEKIYYSLASLRKEKHNEHN